jgi:hypothetical protein
MDLEARWRRWSTPVAIGVIVLMLAATAYGLSVVLPRVQSHPATWGIDFHLYLGYTQRWLDGQGYYLDYQLAGPYAVTPAFPPLYPPPFTLFVVPFLYLPAVLWWVLPLGLIAWVVLRWRPTPWAWAGIAACVAWPRTYEIVIDGNPSMWIAAFAAAGTILAWPYVLVLLKPSLAPFALLGIRHRSWWVALGVCVLVSLPFGAMWLDWVTAVRNADQDLLYSLRDVPIVLIPLIAWWGGSRRERQAASVQ